MKFYIGIYNNRVLKTGKDGKNTIPSERKLKTILATSSLMNSLWLNVVKLTLTRSNAGFYCGD